MSPQAAISKTVIKSSIPKVSVNRGCNDDANAQRHRSEQDGKGGVVLLNDFFPQVVRGDLVDHQECAGKNDNADRGVNNSVYDVADLDAHLLASCVVVIAAVYRPVRAGIVPNGPGHILDFI